MHPFAMKGSILLSFLTSIRKRSRERHAQVVAKLISSSITCKRLRGPILEQKMTNLPPDRGEIRPPFINIACDVFGPWVIKSKKTRGGVALKKC